MGLFICGAYFGKDGGSCGAIEIACTLFGGLKLGDSQHRKKS